MSPLFPKRRNTDTTAEAGVNLVSTIINDHFGWIFRRTHQEHDYGIDAYFDQVDEDGNVTGKSIAVQIKTGKSYLLKTGPHHKFRGSPQHLNYYLNLPNPVLLVICDEEAQICYWAHLQKDKIDYQEDRWSHPVPKDQTLDKINKQKVNKLFGTIEDHISELQADLKFLNQIEKHAFIHYMVPREDIESLNIKNLQSFIERITKTEKLTLATQGKLLIATYGYEDDPREVHQIKEVRRWTVKARKKIQDWFLCTTEYKELSTLQWIAACTCGHTAQQSLDDNGEVVYLVTLNPAKIMVFMQECHNGLNTATEKWNWPIELNYEISKQIAAELLPDMPFPELE